MNKEEWFVKNAGRYRLIRMVIGGNDLSDAYTNGWKDKSMYMFMEITADGRFFLKAHTPMGEKVYEYFFDPEEMKYYLKADRSSEGTPISIDNGLLTEETNNHLMVYELTDELTEV